MITLTHWVATFLGVVVLFAFTRIVLDFIGLPSVRCWWKTSHRNHEALGSIASHLGPHYVYKCRDCGHVWYEPWEK